MSKHDCPPEREPFDSIHLTPPERDGVLADFSMRIETKHTPGPWNWLNYPDGRKLLSGTNRAVIHCPDAPIGIERADADLIAAAPDLLICCQLLLNDMIYFAKNGLSANRTDIRERAEAAIAKATGDQP